MKSRTEYRAANTSGLYQPVTKFALNSFRRKLDVTVGVATSAENIRTILESDFANKVHPIREYLTALPLLNPAGHEYIKKLLSTVQVANSGKWEEYFTKWLVGVVANAMNDTGCQNHTCLVLTGDKQGQFKTWWLDNLCPSPLKKLSIYREDRPTEQRYSDTDSRVLVYQHRRSAKGTQQAE